MGSSSVTMSAVTTSKYSELSDELRSSLLMQGFRSELGSYALVPGTGLKVMVGLGEVPASHEIRHAFETVLPTIPPGTTVDVEGLDGLELAVATSALLARGLTVNSATHDEKLIAEAVISAQNWTNASGCELHPEAFAILARETAITHGLEINVLDREALTAGGFGGLLAIGQGSKYSPQLVDLLYRPDRPQRRVCLVGKGITFDTGGLSLKTPVAMMGMRMDKAGASIVLALMSALSQLNIPVEVRGLLALAENMPGPESVRPGDVVTARNGKTIQILDTDFEGRVVMADALAYGGEREPDVIIDIATLTYQIAIALGNDIGGLFSNDDALADELMRASARVGEPLWRLPLASQYRDQVLTPSGVKNHPESDVGRAITAGLFLESFVPTGTRWAHLDITGPAWRGKASDAGATAFGINTLLEFLRD